jgi:hypothetical protein
MEEDRRAVENEKGGGGERTALAEQGRHISEDSDRYRREVVT